MYSFFPIFFLLTLLVPLGARADWESSELPRLYEKAWISQNEGTYEEWLLSLPHKEKIKDDLREHVRDELEVIRRMPKTQREGELQNFLRYYSEAHGQFLPSAVGFEKHAGYTWNQLVEGKYDSQELANSLIRRSRKFDDQVLEPLLSQVESQLVNDFPGRNIFALGRDFTAGYLYMKWRGKIPKENLYTLNVSRKIKELIEGGKTTELRNLVYSLGLTKEKLVKEGIVFVDSSKAGKIPRALLKAFVEDMSDAEATEFLKKTDTRYIKSSVPKGVDLRGRVNEYLKQKQWSLSRNAINQVIAELWAVPEFSLILPKDLRDYKADKNHHFFEHRPKFIRTAENFIRKKGQHFLNSPPPRTPAEKINSMLGLYADLKFSEDVAQKDKPRKQDKPKEKKELPQPLDKEPWLKAKFKEITKASEEGFAALVKWQNQREPLADADFGKLRMTHTGDPDFPYLLETPYRNYRLSEPIGEGNNVIVYLTTEGTALKVIKDSSNVRKQFLQAWASELLERAGITTAKPLWISPSGLLLAQEYIPSDALEVNYGHGQKLPSSLKNQILDHRKKLIELSKSKGIYFDPKAANYHERDGKIVFVDYTPRLNTTYWKYYKESPHGHDLSEADFLDQFLHHEVNRGRAQNPVYKKCEKILKRIL